LTIRNSTFTANGSNNGAVLADSGTVNLYNNIFANSDSGADCYRNNITGAIVNFSAGASNLIETNAVAPNNCGVAVTNYIAADPDLGTLTGSPGYYPLNVSSPAINVGDVATCNTIDTIGTDRTTTYAPCDLGAFESLVVATCTDVTVTSFAQLSAAITDYNTNCIAGDTKTVTVSVPVTDTITYTGTLPTISNATNATLTIQDGTLNGVDTYLLLTITNGNVTLNNMDLLDGDSTGAYSGGINNAGTLTIINSRFTGNRSNGNGGAIYNSGIATVTGSTFTNNTVSAGGGAISNHNQLIVSNSTFTGGIAGSGGAIYSQFSLQVSNSTFSNNQAAFGGGAIHNRFTATATLTNNTFSANTDTGNQGGAVYTGLGATTTLQNNILANSTSGIDCYKNASTITFSAGTSNLIETDAGGANACGVAGTNYISADPDLGTLTGSPA
jgi:predicted outer membrane repeat protein